MDFSVNSLHSIEKKMKSEIARLMKATNVSSVADLNQKVLSDKLNKGPLSEYLSSVARQSNCYGSFSYLNQLQF